MPVSVLISGLLASFRAGFVVAVAPCCLGGSNTAVPFASAWVSGAAAAEEMAGEMVNG